MWEPFHLEDFAVEPNVKPLTLRTSNLSTIDISKRDFAESEVKSGPADT